MNKKVIGFAAAFVILAALLCACGIAPAAAQTYQYVGKNDLEGYHVEGTMAVSGGVIQSMEWKIIDSNGRVFDETYEEEYTGIELYIQQCRDNWSGMQTFVPALLQTQDLGEVDAVSGATWAYNKFKEAAKALLEQASE